MSDNWVVQNLQRALEVWNEKFTEIWKLLSQSPEEFKDGAIWEMVKEVHGALQAIGLALLVLFFVIGIMKSLGSLEEIKRPEVGIRLFLRFVLSKAVITYGLELMMAILTIVQGIISTIMQKTGAGGSPPTALPQEMITAIEECNFFESIPLWAITLIGSLVIWVLSFMMILTVYGRFFKLYMYTAIAPIPLASFAGEGARSMGLGFLRSYGAVCLEGVIIVLACTIFSFFASSPPIVDTSAAAATMVWTYLGELIFNMLILVGTVKLSDKMVRDMMGI